MTSLELRFKIHLKQPLTKVVILMGQSTHFMKLKQINVDMVKEALKTSGHSTKMSLSRETGLSVATCGNILSELLITGEVLEIEQEASTGGRPARRFVYNENFASVASVYFRKEGDTDYMVCVVSNLLGNPIFEKQIEENGLSMETIENTIDTLVSDFPNLRVLTLGIPGVVHQGAIGYSHFESLAYYPLEEKLMDKYDLLVTAENDMNATAVGYYNSYAKDKPESLAYLYYPKDGISGAGIIVNGRIVKGHSNFAGEISLIPLGLSHSEQKKIQQDAHAFSDFVCRTVATVNGIINPQKVVLCGYYFKDPFIDKLEHRLKTYISEKHMPELIFETDVHKSYLKGLTHIALEQLKCNIEIVEK